MRRLAVALAVLAALGAAPAPAAESYVPGFDDLPLAPGLRADPDGAVAIDDAAGRIVSAEAEGAAEPGAVRSFYAATLPQLGWRADGGGTYSRGAEKLRLDVTRQGAVTTVRFTLTPP
ncbi:MAG TPA: hypothetical protein VEH84_02060 [Alphaproteobacteria bacterium]|nr:hypothetical protein [Alphaproteobacteria bacterium]